MSNRENIQESIAVLADKILKSGYRDLLGEFESEMHQIKNFAFWHSYMRMVELLLELVIGVFTWKSLLRCCLVG